MQWQVKDLCIPRKAVAWLPETRIAWELIVWNVVVFVVGVGLILLVAWSDVVVIVGSTGIFSASPETRTRVIVDSILVLGANLAVTISIAIGFSATVHYAAKRFHRFVSIPKVFNGIVYAELVENVLFFVFSLAFLGALSVFPAVDDAFERSSLDLGLVNGLLRLVPIAYVVFRIIRNAPRLDSRLASTPAA